MSHLSAERLAALADAGEWPTPAESAHLADCRHCTAERGAYESLVAGARGERAAIGAPLTAWEGIAAGIRRSALEDVGSGRRSAVGADLAPRRRIVTRVLQIAAGLVLLVGGFTLGRVSTGVGTAMPVAHQAPSADPRSPNAALPEFTSVTDAQAALARHSAAYQQAAAFLAEHDPTAWLDAPEDYRTRLIALERAGRTIREAMEEAPYDPVLTGYYLTTLGQREATLRQLNVALPPGERLNTF